jgi:hypothetical protein
MDLAETGRWGCGMDIAGCSYGIVGGCFEDVNEHSVSNKRKETCNSLRNCQLLVQNCAACSWVTSKHKQYKAYKNTMLLEYVIIC